LSGDKGGAGNHFGYDQTGAEASGEIAHGPIGDPCHGGKKSTISDRQIPNAYFAGNQCQSIASKLYSATFLVTD
jgi:hypothetical protein